MAGCTGITLIKKFSYRGNNNEQWSNQYWFDGSVPADNAAWDTLITALITEEKKLYPASVSVIGAYCYATDNPDDDTVYHSDFALAPIAGTLSSTGNFQLPGDCAVWVRWKTSRSNSKGKPIFLRKYFHPACVNNASADDQVWATQKTALTAFGLKMYDGTFAGGRKIRSQQHGETIVSHAASAYVTTRTLKRRGKRPGS